MVHKHNVNKRNCSMLGEENRIKILKRTTPVKVTVGCDFWSDGVIVIVF